MLIALTAASAFGDEHALTVLGKIGQEGFALPFKRSVYQRTDRDGNDRIVGAAPGTIGNVSGFARWRREDALETKFHQGRKFGGRFDVDAGSAPAIAAGRAAARHVLLAAPCDDPIAAVPGGGFDGRFVDKLHES